MEYQITNGKVVKVDYVWSMPTDIKSRRPLMEVPMANFVEKPKSKKGVYLRSSIMTVAPAVAIASQGVFWNAFLTYIFPWMLDLSKVFCAIKIAQGFYQENRGGGDSNSGMGSIVKYGKWYLIFWCIPWLVTLIDQVGQQMFNDLTK